MLKIFLLLKKIFKARWVFQKPKQKKFIVYDFANSNVIFKYIKRTESAIYYTRWEEINFFILFYIIFNYGLKDIKKNYKKFFFIFVNPKIAITSTSNQVSFYKLKNNIRIYKIIYYKFFLLRLLKNPSSFKKIFYK